MKPVNYLSNLTPLRGIAALLTVIFHVNIMVGFALINANSTGILNRMYLMVDFFFILSGFILSYVYGRYFSEGVSKAAFKKFTIARFARVYPLHFVTLVYTIVLFGISAQLGIPKSIVESQNSIFSIITNLLLLQSMNFHTWFSWVHASWSISTEWWAYMIFPFLVRPFNKLSNTGKLLVLAACFAGYLCITYLLVPIVTVPADLPFVRVNPADLSINVSYQFGFIRCLCGFILGMITYEGFKNNKGKKLLGNGTAMLVFALLLFTSMHLNLPDTITVIFFPLILLSGAYGSRTIDKIFGTTILQKLGDWSFSIYLVHQPLMYTLGNIVSYLNPVKPGSAAPSMPPPPAVGTAWLICGVFILITLLISFLTYRFVEVPARRWLNAKKEAV